MPSFLILAYFRVAPARENTHKMTNVFARRKFFWTNPSDANATDQVVANAKKYLPSIPGIVSFHVGRMSQSHRSVVDQSYQVGLNIQFETKQAEDAYNNHPQHLEFVERRKGLCTKGVVYDFDRTDARHGQPNSSDSLHLSEKERPYCSAATKVRFVFHLVEHQPTWT